MKKPLLITKEKKAELEKDLAELVNVKRKEIADRLNWYRDNAEDNDEESAYSEVLEEKDILEIKIAELEDVIANAQIITKQDTNKVSMGNVIKVRCGNEVSEYRLVSHVESDPVEGKISNESPLGKKLVNKKAGDEFEVDTPSGKKKYTIISIK